MVDVGGGIGVSSLALARSFPKLHFIIQDREKVVKEGEEVFLSWHLVHQDADFLFYSKHWKSNFPEPFHDGRVVFQGEDGVSCEIHLLNVNQAMIFSSLNLLKMPMHSFSSKSATTGRMNMQLRSFATFETRRHLRLFL